MTLSVCESITKAMTQSPSYDDGIAKVIHLTNSNGMSATFMDIGATWLSCTVPVNGTQREVLLRSKNMDEHTKQTAFLGAVVGRFANRLKDGVFSIHDASFQVTKNEGTNALHGGIEGFDKRRWEVIDQANQKVTFGLTSADGDQGFPGKLVATVQYVLTENNAVEIHYNASVDKDCPINLTNHAYFNLSGTDVLTSCLEHSLTMDATHYLPTESDMLPTGELKVTKGTVFDFSSGKKIGEGFLEDDDQKIAGGIDHAFLLEPSKTDGESVAISLLSPDGCLEMTVKTTKPAVQVYTANFLQGVVGPEGEYENYSAVALETQYLPDGPNHPEWGEWMGVTAANEPYKHKTTYTFNVK
ncbi:galactose-1-epimerase [Vibrio viridaestus]|nr:galactose-1-epimerase [Vibrio viridaestus]